MFQNYFKIGLRNLGRNKLFSLINISGMAISMASFLIIALFVHDELQYDKHVRDVSRKFRVYNDYFYEDGTVKKLAMVPPMVAPTMKAEYPEVEAYARFMNFYNPVLFEAGTKKFSEANGGYADPYFLEMFSLKLVEGNMADALKEPNTVAINQTLAKKYFEDKPALGETIEIFNEPFKVSAVFEDFPVHSHLQLNYFVAMGYLINAIPERMQSWGWSQLHTYIQLKPGTDLVDFDKKLRSMVERHAWPTERAAGSYYIPHLMPVDKIHLHASDHVWDIAVRGNAQTVYILFATAIFIIVIAILNFVNLSTSRAISRVKEVGVRKVIGAFRSQLMQQFISESVIISLIALVIGGLIVELLLPMLNSFTDKRIPTGIFLDPVLIVILVVAGIAIGIAAGAYPAFYISAYKPAQILSNKGSGRTGRHLLRKGLVVLQFMLSFFLIIASFIVSEQHTYLRTKDMGFDKDNLLIMQLRGDMDDKPEEAKAMFSNHPNVISASLQYGLPGEAYAGETFTDAEKNKKIPTSMLVVDHDYVKTLGLDLIAGRDFSRDFPSDEDHAFIVSEAAAKLLGYSNPEDAVNHQLAWERWDAPDTLKQGKVIGVVKDFHLNSLRENITPVVIQVYPFGFSSIALRVKPENLPETIAHFEATWKKFNSEWPFEYRFLDDNFDRLYKAEEKLATLFTFFTGFTIFVACLGLFGLVVYSTTLRYKEISIRKVLGAKELSLVLGLSKMYMVLISIAFLIAVPLSYLAAAKWLENFAFHIDITPLLFVKAALLIAGISLLTVGVQAFKAARSNPVDALKEP